MKTLLLFDFNNLLYTSYFACNGLSFGGKSTAGIYGFIRQMTKYVNQYKPDRILICGDSKPYLREEFVEGYKKTRERYRDKERSKQIADNRTFCNEFLAMTGIQKWKIKGLEADDLFAGTLDLVGPEYSNIVMVSNDSDLHQLLVDKRVILQTGKYEYSYKNVPKEWKDFPLDKIPLAIALMGSHNDVKGIKGIGPKTAVKLIKNQLIDNTLGKIYAENETLINLNLKLVKLPFQPITEMPVQSKIVYDERAMLKFMCKTGITLTQEMRDAFQYMWEL